MGGVLVVAPVPEQADVRLRNLNRRRVQGEPKFVRAGPRELDRHGGNEAAARRRVRNESVRAAVG